ncbi:MAG: hypothetical protein J5I52_00485 [Saprospiraceae bacterium]|nr:hypothetical protein [Saprospiraceae bacterium]MCZ2337548.1 rhodanese-like domain-containing protein [Chitinophagales bacterium]
MSRYTFLTIVFLFLLSINSNAQDVKTHWTAEQLMSPDTLAKRIQNHQTEHLTIVSVGYDDIIAGGVYVGAGEEEASINALRQLLQKTPKDQEVVIYCGCCPFAMCPNIRAPFQLLQEMGFKNAKLLNLKQNIKADWLDHDYPIKDE